MIIISGGDDSRMKEIIEKALTEAGETFTLNEDESDIITPEQASALMVYNASKIRTYLGRLERNTRKQELSTNAIGGSLQLIAELLEPVAVYFESQLGEDVPTMVRRTNPHSRLEFVRQQRAKEIRRARESDEQASKESS